MKKIIVMLLVFVAMLSAAFVDVDTAKKTAENYYKNYASVADKGNEVKGVISHEYEGEVTWYGINFDKGFVIITAEDALKPILGYSFKGQVPDGSRAGGLNFKEWFGFYDKQIKVAREYSYVDASAQAEWKNIKNNVFETASKGIMIDALLESRWDQVYPWNDLCPEKDDTWTYVGCVATAASMIARYHEWPPSGTGSNTNSSTGTSETYSNYSFSYPQMQHEVVMEWGLYPTYWESINMDAAAIQNTAELCYLLGHSFDMNYGTTADGGSGAVMSAAAAVFQSNWFYNTNYTSIGTIVDKTAYATTIRAELDAKRPWWWAGGVHSFNLDGYTDDYWYHFNWGWGGYCDGWYQLSALIPDDTGSGGGDSGDYTTIQRMVSCVPNTDPFTNWPEPTNVNGSVANDEDITITWNAPSGGGTLMGYDLYKSTDGAYGTLLANLGTGTTSYQDLNQVAGIYSYYIFAIYDDGISHKSSSYRADISPSANFPVIRSLAAEVVGRTNIDLTWLQPFIGSIDYVTGFEDGVIPAGWLTYSSVAVSKNDPKPTSFWTVESENIFLLDATTAPHIVFRGEYACVFSTASTANLWLFTPEFTLASDTFIKFWTRFKGNPDTSQYPRFSVAVKEGGTSWTGRDSYATIIDTFDADPASPESAAWNEWESEWEVPISGFSGQSMHIGIMNELPSTNHYTFTIDDILIGSYTGGVADDPSGLEIFRNDVSVATIAGTATSYSDTGFVDGDNEYFIRALYPTPGASIPSEKVLVNMNANPKPDYLTGILNGSDGVDLNWYMPYGMPSHWATLITPENCTRTIDYLEDEVEGIIPCDKRRAEFKAEDVGLYYPVTIDSIAGGFFEWEDDLWGANNTFVIRLWDGHPHDGTGALLWESGTLTATPGEIYSVGLDQSYVLNGEWNVEVEALDAATGHPSTLAGPSTNGISCYFFRHTQDSYNYYVSSGGGPLSYNLMAHCTGSDPSKTAGWTSNDAVYKKMPIIDNAGRLIAGEPVTTSKALSTYNVYRDGGHVGSTTTLSYTDSPGAATDYTYYVKAAYTAPDGESAASNSVVIHAGGGSAPEVPVNIITSIVGSNLVVDWDVSANATGYDVYSSDNPYGTFTLVTSVSTNQYTVAASQAKLFYYIIATN